MPINPQHQREHPMHTRTTATALAALGLLTTLATVGATATTAVAATSAPAPCAQEYLALLNAEDALTNVDALPEVKAAHAALMKAGAAADVDQLSQKMALQQLGVKAPSLDPAAKKMVDAYNAAGAKYVQVRDAALLKVAPKRQNSRETLKRCLTAHS
ncbi:MULTISPECIES: hypothetical protein [unclassified Streptosporangium]|uniref:hypothetical protein n=1 Tax=unclassified Streptosporangium TaxID=2632669 RepID=UPI002E28B749|nr:MULTISPECIES: hypothetical protein [unclassified Streptosporangium]